MTIKEKILSTFKGKEGRTFKPHEIIDLIKQKYPDTNPSSIIPADRCYNKINIGIEKYFDFHVFEALDDGSYKFLGEEKPFTGYIKWKGRIVGEWLDGKIVWLKKLQ
ncbi:hypothetical protein HRH25_09360 [Flavisolibacter sp. BT320]|nr:hypothetical protein [Flavisolibacter longurius]